MTTNIAPIFDIALEELLDGDVTCRAGDGPATHRIWHDGHCAAPPAFACATHAAMVQAALDTCRASHRHPICVDCAHAMPVHLWTITPL